MTEEQRAEIADLAAKAHDLEMRYQALGMQNVCGLTPEERRQQSVDYALAHAEMIEALAARDAAIVRLGAE